MSSAKSGIDLSTILGICIGVGSLVTAMFLEFNELNPDLGSPFLQVSALLIIFGGTLGASMLSFTLEEILTVPSLIGILFFQKHVDPNAFITKVVDLATLARKEGILHLEQLIPDMEKSDPFFADGLRLVIDGVEPQTVQTIMENKLGAMEHRHSIGQNIFNNFGGFAPTMGIIGTVVGLIAALAKAGEGMEGAEGAAAIVGAIATAFIATFYGIGSANLIFLPMGNKLKEKSAEEVFFKELTLKAIQALQSGENPRVIFTKLSMSFKPGIIKDIQKK